MSALVWPAEPRRVTLTYPRPAAVRIQGGPALLGRHTCPVPAVPAVGDVFECCCGQRWRATDREWLGERRRLTTVDGRPFTELTGR